jgi:hypothetical protein
MYQILEPFEYRTNENEIIKIEVGFVLDFASTPWWIRWRYPAIGWYAKAVAIHDKGYKDHDSRLRIWWDDIMKEGMEILAIEEDGKITKKKQTTIDRFYWAVDNFGAKSWNKS